MCTNKQLHCMWEHEGIGTSVGGQNNPSKTIGQGVAGPLKGTQFPRVVVTKGRCIPGGCEDHPDYKDICARALVKKKVSSKTNKKAGDPHDVCGFAEEEEHIYQKYCKKTCRLCMQPCKTHRGHHGCPDNHYCDIYGNCFEENLCVEVYGSNDSVDRNCPVTKGCVTNAPLQSVVYTTLVLVLAVPIPIAFIYQCLLFGREKRTQHITHKDIKNNYMFTKLGNSTFKAGLRLTLTISSTVTDFLAAILIMECTTTAYMFIVYAIFLVVASVFSTMDGYYSSKESTKLMHAVCFGIPDYSVRVLDSEDDEHVDLKVGSEVSGGLPFFGGDTDNDASIPGTPEACE